jgi:hypothetical protein
MSPNLPGGLAGVRRESAPSVTKLSFPPAATCRGRLRVPTEQHADPPKALSCSRSRHLPRLFERGAAWGPATY